jgi:hypothetical protein
MKLPADVSPPGTYDANTGRIVTKSTIFRVLKKKFFYYVLINQDYFILSIIKPKSIVNREKCSKKYFEHSKKLTPNDLNYRIIFT